MRFRLSTKPSWPELRARLNEVLPAAFPQTGFSLAAEEESPWLGWHEGPADTAVAGAVGQITGWQLRPVLLDPDPDAPALATLELRRTYSERALAIGVIRFQASNTRPYDSSRPAARARLWAILDTDHPARVGYPLVAAMTEMLLAAPDPPPPPAGVPDDPADRLSWRLQSLGYERLWSTAWSSVEL